MAIQRNTLVAPFSVKTPFNAPKQKGKDDEPIGSSGIARPHIVWFQSVERAINATPQLSATVPTSSAFAGQPGDMAFDANFLYVCVGVGIWRRVGLASF
jgi:hypothetical protein